jgi:UDP-glucose 4-epimerase
LSSEFANVQFKRLGSAMNFLVTGGAGFLGAALANRLVHEDHQVRVIDNLTSGDPARLDPAVFFDRGDVADIPKLWTVLHGVDCVYHLAARVSVAESILYPRDYNHVNVGGTVSVMEAMRDAGVKRVVLASSGAVYGEQDHQPVAEDQHPNPDSPYAVSKLAAEFYVRTIGALWGIETVALRIFNAYGPGQRMRPAHPPVVPQFLRQALTGGSLVILGGGEQTRDFVYVDDVLDALVASATAEGVDTRVINIGSGVEVGINALGTAVEKVVGRSVSVVHNTEQSGGVSRLCADISQARQLLGFEPKTSLEEGLRRTIELDPKLKRLRSR